MKPQRQIRKYLAVAVVVAVIAMVAVWPVAGGSTYLLGLGIAIGCYAIVAVGIDFAFGRAGLLSIGHGVFFGTGAYVIAIASQHTSLSASLLVLLAGTASGLLGAVMGAIFLRVGGYYFTVATLGSVLIMASIVRGLDSTGGAAGLAGVNRNLTGGDSYASDETLYVVVVVTLGLFILSATRFGRTRMGRAVVATRQMPKAASVFGISSFTVRLRAFTISAVAAGVAGAFFAMYQQYVSPEVASLFQSVQFLIMNVAGGLGTGWGPAIGALFVRGLPEAVGPLRDYQVLTQGLILIFVLIWARSGIAGGVRRLWAIAVPPENPPSAIVESASRQPAKPAVGAATPADAILLVDGVSVQFGGLRAVDQVSLSLSPGRIAGLIGPNGAGKSTMLNVISGLQAVSGGKVTFRGEDITSVDARKRAYMGMSRTFQFVDIAPDLSVVDNVAVGAYRTTKSGFIRALIPFSTLKEEREIRCASLAVLDRLGIGELAWLTTAQLSAGQLRMLDVARALVSDPEVLLLDEPAAGLTEPEVDVFAECLEDLRVSGIALLLVEHDMRLVQRVCDDVVVVDSGTTIATGLPSVVTSDPRVIEAYLGTGAAK